MRGQYEALLGTCTDEDKVKVSKFRIGDYVYVEGSIKHDKMKRISR